MQNQNYYVDPHSIVDLDVTIGEGTKIWAFSHIQSGAKIGRNCIFGQNVNVGNNVIIGDHCKIQNNVSLYEGVILENYVFCGPSMVFTNVLYPKCKYPKNTDDYVKTLVREGASIGANTTIVCGNTIGKHSLIGAGSVVSTDVPEYALFFGVPGKVVGWVSEAGNRLQFDKDGLAFCSKSKKKYKLENKRVFEIE